MSSAASLLDAVLADPVTVPAGLDAWLRWIVAQATQRQRALTARCELPHALDLLVDTRGAVDRFLDDAERGAVQRTLRRPLVQLKAGTPAHRSFDQLTRHVIARADHALELQEAADDLRASRDALCTRFGDSLPYFAEHYVREARLTDADLARIASVADTKRAPERIRWLRDQLQEMANEIGITTPVAQDHRASGRETTHLDHPTISEFRALLARRIRARAVAAQGTTGSDSLQALRKHHRASLLANAGRAAAGESSAEQLAALLMTRAEADARAPTGADETMLWYRALDESARWMELSIHRPHWAPAPVVSERQSDLREADSDYSVVALSDKFAVLTRRHPSAVQLRTTAPLEPGLTVQVRAVGTAGRYETADLAALDLKPLFDGLVPRESAWYRTTQNAQLVVVERDGDEWYAELGRRGDLECTGGAAWNDRGRSADAVRVLHRPHTVDPDVVLPVGVDPERSPAPSYFLGFRTETVRSPLAGHRFAWLRSAEPSTAAREQALTNEAELFRRLRSHVTAEGTTAQTVRVHAPQYLGRAQMTDGTPRTGVLYGPPLMEPADGAVVSTWIASDVQARNDALQAAARAAVSALDVGFSVGLFHLKLFGARLDVRDGQAARLDLALTRAPLATPYGKSVCTTAPAAELESLTYPRLRYRGIVPAAEAGQIASPMTDAAAFLLFALDVLSAHVTPNVTAPWQTWEDVWMSIDSRADVAFRDPVMVRSLTRAVRENRPLPIWEFIRALAR